MQIITQSGKTLVSSTHELHVASWWSSVVCEVGAVFYIVGNNQACPPPTLLLTITLIILTFFFFLLILYSGTF